MTIASRLPPGHAPRALRASETSPLRRGARVAAPGRTGVAGACPRRAVAGVALVLAILPAAAPGFAQHGDAFVIVNGRPISERRIIDTLMEAHGLEIMQQIIIVELARAECARLGLHVTPADIEAERRLALDQIARESNMDPGESSEANKQQALQTMLEQKGVSMTEFLLSMERNAHLRKIVARDFSIDEQTLREEFARTHGERVQVRHIQVPVREPGRLNDALTLLDRGADFADVARELSVNVDTAPRGGELPPFAFDDDRIDPLLREAAFSLAEGERSAPVRTDRYYHILKLERRIPPQNLRFEDVRDQVEAAMRERVLTGKMRDLVTELFNRADIKVVHPAMRARYQEFLRQARGD